MEYVIEFILSIGYIGICLTCLIFPFWLIYWVFSKKGDRMTLIEFIWSMFVTAFWIEIIFLLMQLIKLM